MKVYEKGMKSLLVEADALRQEVAICKSNLEKARVQVFLHYSLPLDHRNA